MRDRNGALVYNDRTPGEPMLAPLDWTPLKPIQVGEGMKAAYDAAFTGSGDGAAARATRDLTMYYTFKSGGVMDLQLNYNGNQQQGPFNYNFIDVGYYSFGIAAAAAGYSYEEAMFGAGGYNVGKSIAKTIFGEINEIDTSGHRGVDAAKQHLIKQGYDDFFSGKLR